MPSKRRNTSTRSSDKNNDNQENEDVPIPEQRELTEVEDADDDEEEKDDHDEDYYYHRAMEAAQAHADWQNNILNDKDTASSQDIKFLIFEPVDTGIGNQLEAILSSYLYAMMTRRVFLMRSNKYHPIIDFRLNPIDETDVRVQDYFSKRPTLYGTNYTNNEYFMEVGKLEQTAVPICEDMLSPEHKLMKQNVLVLKGNMYFADLFFYNPYLRKTYLDDIFGPRELNKNNPFKPLYQWFVQLQPDVLQNINDIKEREFNDENTITIGLQMRMSESYATLEQADTFWDCALSASNEIISSNNNYNNNKTKVRYFISTDNPSVQKKAKEHFRENNDNPSNIEIFFRTEIDRVISPRSKRDIVGAIVDVTLLAECDALIVTQASSFGRIAYASSLQLKSTPWFVTFESYLWNTRNYPPNQCIHSKTTKPCSDRIHNNVLIRNKKGKKGKYETSCLSKKDKEEAYDECDNS